MKNVLLATIASSFFMFSCTEDLENTIQTFDTMSKKKLSTQFVLPLETSFTVDENGTLHFRSAEDYFSISDSLLQLSKEEYESWENEIGFKSYRSLMDSILKIEPINDEVVSKYSDIVYIDSIGTISPKVDFRVYQNVMDSHAEFYVSGIKHKICGNTLITSNTKTREIKEINLLAKSSAGDEPVYYPVIEYCKHFRKIETWFKLYKNTVDVGITKAGSLLLDIYVRPKKQVAVINNYRSYNDKCMVEEVTLHMEGLGLVHYTDELGNLMFMQDQFNSLPTIESSEATPLFTVTYTLFAKSSSPIIMPIPLIKDPVCVHYRARIGDLGKEGIAYNTYHPLQGMDKDNCGHREVTNYQHKEYIFN